MKYAKDLGLTTYNSIIQDIYDANPVVQMSNGNEKEEQKYKQTKKNPSSRVLLKETLRLRNTSLLLLKQKEMIFRYEKERLSQLKVSLPPFDDDIDPNIECECPEEEELDTSFNFPRFRFKIRNWFATVPVPFLAPVPVPAPYTAPETQPGGERQPGGETERPPVVVPPKRERERERPPVTPPRREPQPQPGWEWPRLPDFEIPPIFIPFPPRLPGETFGTSVRKPSSRPLAFNRPLSFDPQKVFSGGSKFRANLGNFILGADPLTGQNPFKPRLQPAVAGVTDFTGTGGGANKVVPSNLFRVRVGGIEVGSYTKGAQIPLGVADEFAKLADMSVDEFARKVKANTGGNISVESLSSGGGGTPPGGPPKGNSGLFKNIRNFRVSGSGLVGFGKNLIKGGPNFIANMIIGNTLDYLGKTYIVDPLTGPDGLLGRSLMRGKFYNKIDEQLKSGMTPEEILARLEAFRDQRIADMTEKGEDRVIPYIEADFKRARNYLMSHKAQKVGDVLDTELKTGPRGRIGAGTEYHIDTKFSKDLPMNRIIEMMDNLALSYQRRGRDIEFSNDAVAGQVYDPNASTEEKADLLRRAFAAHSHSMHSDFHSIDYYIPHTDKGRRDESAEGANILTPTVQGGQVNFGQGGGYGAYVTVTDSQGKVLTKTGHGDVRGARSGSISIPVKPVEKSDADPAPDLMSLLSPINKDTEIGVDPQMEFENELPFLVAPQIQPGSIQYVPVPIDMGTKVEFVLKDPHTPLWGHNAVVGG